MTSMSNYPATLPQELLITQRAFRAAMDALARPGRVYSVPAMPRPTLANPWLETLTQMLLDSTCSFCVAASDEQTLSLAIRARTYAQLLPCQQARFAIIAADASVEQSASILSALSGGTDEAPELGATALIECAALFAPGEPSPSTREVHWFGVTGPGVASKHLFGVSCSWWQEVRLARADEFPCGIDLILVDQIGRLIALPRTARLAQIRRAERERG